MGTTNWLYIAARLWRFMMKVNRDGVGGRAEVHIMVRFFFFFPFFSCLEELKALRMVWRNGTKAELFFPFFGSERQKDYRKKDGAKRKRKVEREMGGNERGHSLCIVNTVDWGALHVLLFFQAAWFVWFTLYQSAEDVFKRTWSIFEKASL